MLITMLSETCKHGEAFTWLCDHGGEDATEN